MYINKYYFVLFFLCICVLDFAFTLSRENSGSSFVRNLNGKKPITTTSKPPIKRSFFRLTATLIIIYILAVIFTGIFIYYFCMCYPILCRKERNYDVVEHSRDTTPTPNIEKIP